MGGTECDPENGGPVRDGEYDLDREEKSAFLLIRAQLCTCRMDCLIDVAECPFVADLISMVKPAGVE
jgi:hypothetical protein